MLTIEYCEVCEKRLRSYGDFAFELFDLICYHYLMDNVFEVSSDIHDMTHGYLALIHFLERKGFIVSTESSQSCLQIKPLGLSYSNLGNHELLFCLH